MGRKVRDLIIKLKPNETIAFYSRRNKSSSWILKAAVKLPECVVVCKSSNHALLMEKKYDSLLSKAWIGKRIWWQWFGRKRPLFIPANDDFRSFRLPIIFDSSVFL